MFCIFHFFFSLKSTINYIASSLLHFRHRMFVASIFTWITPQDGSAARVALPPDVQWLLTKCLFRLHATGLAQSILQTSLLFGVQEHKKKCRGGEFWMLPGSELSHTGNSRRVTWLHAFSSIGSGILQETHWGVIGSWCLQPVTVQYFYKGHDANIVWQKKL